jgi:hypothetical protein
MNIGKRETEGEREGKKKGWKKGERGRKEGKKGGRKGGRKRRKEGRREEGEVKTGLLSYLLFIFTCNLSKILKLTSETC